jgi:hypothetical protein
VAAYEVLLLNTAVPQIQAAQTGDTYVVPRDIAFSAALTLSAGTANGVPYLNGSKVLTTGSALTFDGTTLTSRVNANAALQLAFSATNATNADFNVRIANSLTDLQVSSATPLSFTLGATEQMRLTSTGLGIGTSSVFCVLTAQTGTNARFEFTSASTVGSLEILNNVRNAYLDYDVYASIHRWKKLGSTAMTLDSSGNLGIGTPSPTFKLQVIGTSQLSLSAAGTQQALQLNNSDTTAGTQAVKLGFSSAGVTKASVNAAVYGNDYMTFNVGSDTERMRLDSSGNLGLGVTPTTGGYGKGFQLSGDPASDLGTLWIQPINTNDHRLSLTNNAKNTGVGTWGYYASSQSATMYQQVAGEHQFFTAGTGTAGNAISFTQAMTLDASGNLGVGIPAALYSTERLAVFKSGNAESAAFVNDAGANNYTVAVSNRATTGDNKFMVFATESSDTTRGSIVYNRGAGLVTYATTSDYRAKDILGPVSNPGATIDALKVYSGKMKGATVYRPMLIAHEAQAVTPYAVTGEKDAVDEDGKPNYQQMDVSSLVPLLIAEIQSLRARVAQLEQGV